LGLNVAGEKFEAAAEGNGPVDAAIKALKKIINRQMTLKEFTIQAISKGSDDVGKVHMQVEYQRQLLLWIWCQHRYYCRFGRGVCGLYQ
jgi:2-isopropylmalate synthase